jgi:hypothetical protein
MADDHDFDARGIALDGERCLGRLVRDDGAFLYAYDADTRDEVREYDLIRHAMACWGIGRVANELGGLDAERAAAHRAMTWLVDGYSHAMGRARCVVQGDSIFLGASALTALALIELAANGEAGARHLESAQQYVDFVLACREPDGDFIHRIDTRNVEIDPWRSNFYTGQGLLALVRCSQATSQAKYLDAAAEMIAGFEPRNYGVDVHSHWMAHALSALHRSTGEDRLVAYAGRIVKRIIDEPHYRQVDSSSALACRAEALGAYGEMLVRTEGRTTGPRWADVMTAMRHDLALLTAYRLDDGAFLMNSTGRLVQIDIIQHAALAYFAYARLSDRHID